MTTERFQRLLATCDTRTQMHASTRKSYSQVTRKWLASVAQVLATVNNGKHCSQVTRKSLAGVSQISRKFIYMPTIYFWPLIWRRGDGRHQLLVYVVTILTWMMGLLFPKSHITEPSKSPDYQLIIVTSIDWLLCTVCQISLLHVACQLLGNQKLSGHSSANCRNQNFGRHVTPDWCSTIGACALQFLSLLSYRQHIIIIHYLMKLELPSS